jgi:hypothetical protein
MHRHNRKYGHSAVLSSYCGQPGSKPILGEIQHSLFLSTHHFDSSMKLGPRRESGRLGVKFFSWNRILPFKNQVPIGDPLWYVLPGEKDKLPQFGRPTLDTIRVMPKLNEELDPIARVEGYAELLGKTLEKYPGKDVVVSLHPRDHQLTGQLADSVDRTGWRLSKPAERQAEGKEAARSTLLSLADCDMIVSDYIGAHVIRGCAMMGIPFDLLSSQALHRMIHPRMLERLEELLNPLTDFDTKVMISQEILGLEFVRSREELASLLYGSPQQPEVVGRIRVASYKKLRRWRVRLRESSFWGRSRLARYFRKKVSFRLRESNFKKG